MSNMAASVFEMFKLGVGPSSSHTVGPMRAALLFVQELQKKELLPKTERVVCELMGSLGATGRGHATDKAVLLGLSGKAPATVTGRESVEIPREAEENHVLSLAGIKRIAFDPDCDMIFSADKVLCVSHQRHGFDGTRRSGKRFAVSSLLLCGRRIYCGR